jgi:ribosome-binding protein aMBF1 (putative translation factor)
MTDESMPISPFGSTAASAAKRRYDSSPEYREQHERLAPYRAIASAVILARGAKGMTQKQLADALGTTDSAISRIESGRHPVTLDTLDRLGRALDLAFRVGSESVAGVVVVPSAAIERHAPKVQAEPALSGTPS